MGGKLCRAIEEKGVMANRDWNLIASGATFEALATTLVFFEDPKAALFGRRGKDGGQDARSGDGLASSRRNIMRTAPPPKPSRTPKRRPRRSSSTENRGTLGTNSGRV